MQGNGDKHPLFKKHHHQYEEFVSAQTDSEALSLFSICVVIIHSEIDKDKRPTD